MKIKRITALILSAVICVCIFSFGASAVDTDRKNYLVIGDSIAEGFGISNPDESAYGRIVADTNGYNYINDGIMGRNSATLLKRLTEDESFMADVEWADIISVSIGGNDFLLDHAPLLIIQGLVFNDYAKFDKIGETFYDNFSKCMEQIRTLNPDAVVLVQTIYTAWNTEFSKKPYEQATKRINDGIIKYCEENPENNYVVDTRDAFAGRPALISSDTIHPSAEGNVVLSRLVLAKLNEIGLSDTTEPVVNVKGIDRDYLVEYFPKPIGKILTFLANLLTGNFRYAR